MKAALYEDADDREDRVDRIVLLSEKRKEYQEHVRALEDALHGLGCYKDENGRFQAKPAIEITKGYNQVVTTPKPQSGINIRGQLSFRGQQKAEEYFIRLDEDRDGYLTYEDFRAMTSLGRYPYGIAHDDLYKDWDAWKMHMADAGVTPDFLGRITQDQFVRYRIWQEKQPREIHLEPEIVRAGLGVLPATQLYWSEVKQMVEDVIVDREYLKLLQQEQEGAREQLMNVLNKVKRDDGPKLPLKERLYDEILELDEMEYILVNLGVVYPRGMLAHLLRERAQREKLLEHLAAKKMRQVYGDSPNKMVQFMSPGGTLQIPREPIILKLEDVKFVTVSQFIAWCMSDKVPPPKTTGTYRTILRCKYGFYRWIRETNRYFKHIYDVAQHLRGRSVFRDFQPPPPKSALHPDKSNRSTTLLNVTVGKGGMIDNPGLEISGRLSKLEGPMFDLKCTKMKFPKDFGTVLSIDIDLRSTAAREDVRAAVEALKLLLRVQVEPELRKCAPFKSLLCFPAISESDGGKTIRIALVAKRTFSLDAFLSYLALPYTFMDIVQEFSFDFKINMSINEMIYSSFAMLEGSFAARLESKMTYTKHFIATALDRAIQAINFAPNVKQTKMPPDDRAFKAFETLERLRKLFPTVSQGFSTALTYLRGLRSSALKFRFRTLTEFLERMSLVSLWSKNTFPIEISTGVGYLCDEFDAWRKRMDADLKGIYEDLKVFLEAEAIRSEQERLRKKELAQQRFDELSSAGGSQASDSGNNTPRGDEGGGGGGGGGDDDASRASGATKASLVEKLRRLGVTNDTLEQLIDDEPKDPRDYAKYISDNTSKSDVQSYLVWEKVSKVCNGINSIDIFCGKAMLNLDCSGLDLFPLIPEVLSIQGVKDEIAKKKLWRLKFQRQLAMVGASAEQQMVQESIGAGSDH